MIGRVEKDFMELLDGFVNSVNDVIWSYILIIMLLALGVYFSFATKFVQIRLIGEMLRLLTQGVGKKADDNKVSSFQAFCISTASRVGVGNIAGTSFLGIAYWFICTKLVGNLRIDVRI